MCIRDSLKRLFMKIYEDNASGKLSDERFDMMSQSYDAEQKHLEEEDVYKRQVLSASEFHRIMPCGSWAVPPVGNRTLP